MCVPPALQTKLLPRKRPKKLELALKNFGVSKKLCFDYYFKFALFGPPIIVVIK